METITTKHPVRIACIGAGQLANEFHYPSLAEFPDVEIAALCDLQRDRLCATADRFKIEHTFTEYKQMLDLAQPDAVYIVMPPHYLFDLVIECLNRRLHVFIEKPPGITTGQTRSFARLAERNGCLTMVGFQRRFCPVVVEARRQVAERGEIFQCLARFVKSGGADPYYNGAVDILTCDAIHAVDSLRWLGGEVKHIASTVKNVHSEIENAFNALVEFESGAVGMLLTNWMTGRRTFSLEMHSRNISAYAEPDDKAVIYRDNDTHGETIMSPAAAGSEKPHRYLGFSDENRHFIDSIRSGRQPETHFGDAVKTMELVERIYRSRLS